jgi:CCR4-NOT transcription complex subunit 3
MARKLKKEIELCIKKVNDGFGIFERLWEKIYDSDDQSVRQKTAAELKRELKKLQRCRDQIKGWLSTPRDCRDKLQTLKDIKGDIETKMEAFKKCEREVKTKAFSKEGLKQAGTFFVFVCVCVWKTHSHSQSLDTQYTYS